MRCPALSAWIARDDYEFVYDQEDCSTWHWFGVMLGQIADCPETELFSIVLDNCSALRCQMLSKVVTDDCPDTEMSNVVPDDCPGTKMS